MKEFLKRILPYNVKTILIRIIGKIQNFKTAKSFYKTNRFSYTPGNDRLRPDTVVGQFTSIAHNAWIAPGNHPIDMLTTSPFFYAPYNQGKPEYNEKLAKKVMADNTSKKTRIGNDVWIGVNTTIIQGVTIGDGSVVAANCVVTKDVPPYAIVGGTPAHVIRYRFREEQIMELLKLRWWDLSMEEINTLPFDDIDKCIELIRNIRNKKKYAKCVFIITSVICVDSNKSLNYSDKRTIYSDSERNEQTKHTIESIRKNVKNAYIVLVEGGKHNLESKENYDCDEYIYAGADRDVRKAVDSKYKGLGEIKLLLYALSRISLNHYDYIIKVSGRYVLTHQFHLDDFDFSRFNFLNYEPGVLNPYVGESSYRKGSHSTRLYGVPVNKIDIWKKALKRSITEICIRGNGIENVLVKHIKGDVIFYREQLGIEGNIAVSGEKIFE